LSFTFHFYAYLKSYFDGALIGAMLVFDLYYANIYIGAWVNAGKRPTT
jgi:hypothetical protein